jgi:glutathione S-transferase
MLTFYHNPQSRAVSVHWLLEELGAPYTIEHVDIAGKAGGVPESYRAIQPNKKVPAIVHDGVTVTERAAITIYLADAFPEAGLAPAIGDPERGPYLSWLAYVDGVFDPVIAAKFLKWEYSPGNISFGSYEDMLAHIEKALTARPYIVGERFTAADTQFASMLYYALEMLKVLPDKPAFRDYLARVTARPAFQKAMGG